MSLIQRRFVILTGHFMLHYFHIYTALVSVVCLYTSPLCLRASFYRWLLPYYRNYRTPVYPRICDPLRLLQKQPFWSEIQIF